MNSLFTARRVLGLLALFIAGYVLWRGPERFYTESVGTWILSPVIYVRLLPEPLNHWLLKMITLEPHVSNLLCLTPILLLLYAGAFAAVSLARNSLPFAFASAVITGTVFGVYHFVQPLGITLVQY